MAFCSSGCTGRVSVTGLRRRFFCCDWLVAQIVEMTVKSQVANKVRFFYPLSGDALFQVYGWRFLAAHGDRMGSRGGQGFLGALATVIRGMHKMHAYYAAQGMTIDYVVAGHFIRPPTSPRLVSATDRLSVHRSTLGTCGRSLNRPNRI